ncbi:MAG: Flp pilus assembly complex ATPase component TadA, partial [Clostridium sp.]|nr:Flp pilus assembly complex ATPase component TadA [Clostridium sp.]
MKTFQEFFTQAHQQVLSKISYERELSDGEVENQIDECLIQDRILNAYPVTFRIALRRELFNTLRRLGILQKYIDDPTVTEIMIHGKEHIFIERQGYLTRVKEAFESEEKLQDVIQQIVAGCNRVVNEASPIVDARLSNGARVNVVMRPVALNGPIVTIRRFPDKPITMEDLIRMGAITQEAAQFLQTLVQTKYNIFI